MGTEIGRLKGYSFRGTVTAGDGSNQKGGKMGAGYVNLRKPNILLEAIEELRKRTTAGAAKFLVKVKAHRGENEEADIKADKAFSGKDFPTEWYDRKN